MDADLRALERAVASGNGGAGALAALEAARVRAGLGWRGESLPPGLRALRKDGAFELYGLAFGDDVIEFVRVGGGDAECATCGGSRLGYSSSTDECVECGGTGWCPVQAFLLARHPATRREFGSGGRGARRPDDAVPATGVSYADVTTFCAGAAVQTGSGLRLPTAEEFRLAAVGPLVANKDHRWEPEGAHEDDLSTRVTRDYCLRCGASGFGAHEKPCRPSAARRYPWGDDAPTHRHCAAFDTRYGRAAPVVVAGWPDAATFGPILAVSKDLGEVRVVGRSGHFVVCEDASGRRREAKPSWLSALEALPPVLARPAGVSVSCGAHDLLGNVRHWLSDRRVAGAGFGWARRDGGGPFWGIEAVRPDASDDDLGFRLALSFPS